MEIRQTGEVYGMRITGAAGLLTIIAIAAIVAHATALDSLDWNFSRYESSNVTTLNATVYNGTLVVLYGNSNLTGGNYWFIIGSQPERYPWRSDNRTRNVTGYFNKSYTGIPLIQNHTYYYRAASDAGYGQEKSFHLLPMPTQPPTTYSQYGVQFLEKEGNYTGWIDVIWAPYKNKMGETMFYSLMIGIVFIGLSIRQGSTIIPTILFYIIGIPLLAMMRPEFVQIAQMMIIMATVGFVYWLFTKSNG